MELSKTEKAKKLIREKNYIGLFKAIVSILLPRRVFYFDSLYIIGVNTLKINCLRSFGVNYRFASISDVEKMVKIHGNNEAFQNRFLKDCKCLIGEIGDEIAGMIWVRFSENYKTNSEYVFNPHNNDAWVFDIFVIPKYRFRNVFACLMSRILKFVRGDTYDGICGEIHYENEESLKAHLRAGFKIIEKISYVYILGLFIYLVKKEKFCPAIELKYVNPFNKKIALFGGQENLQ